MDDNDDQSRHLTGPTDDDSKVYSLWMLGQRSFHTQANINSGKLGDCHWHRYSDGSWCACQVPPRERSFPWPTLSVPDMPSPKTEDQNIYIDTTTQNLSDTNSETTYDFINSNGTTDRLSRRYIDSGAVGAVHWLERPTGEDYAISACLLPDGLELQSYRVQMGKKVPEFKHHSPMDPNPRRLHDFYRHDGIIRLSRETIDNMDPYGVGWAHLPGGIWETSTLLPEPSKSQNMKDEDKDQAARSQNECSKDATPAYICASHGLGGSETRSKFELVDIPGTRGVNSPRSASEQRRAFAPKAGDVDNSKAKGSEKERDAENSRQVENVAKPLFAGPSMQRKIPQEHEASRISQSIQRYPPTFAQPWQPHCNYSRSHPAHMPHSDVVASQMPLYSPFPPWVMPPYRWLDGHFISGEMVAPGLPQGTFAGYTNQPRSSYQQRTGTWGENMGEDEYGLSDDSSETSFPDHSSLQPARDQDSRFHPKTDSYSPSKRYFVIDQDKRLLPYLVDKHSLDNSRLGPFSWRLSRDGKTKYVQLHGDKESHPLPNLRSETQVRPSYAMLHKLWSRIDDRSALGFMQNFLADAIEHKNWRRKLPISPLLFAHWIVLKQHFNLFQIATEAELDLLLNESRLAWDESNDGTKYGFPEPEPTIFREPLSGNQASAEKVESDNAKLGRRDNPSNPGLAGKRMKDGINEPVKPSSAASKISRTLSLLKKSHPEAFEDLEPIANSSKGVEPEESGINELD